MALQRFAPLRRFLTPTKESFYRFSRPSDSFIGKYERLQLKESAKEIKSVFQVHGSGFQYNIQTKRKCMDNSSLLGKQFILKREKEFCDLGIHSGRSASVGMFIGLSIVTGTAKIWPSVAYAMDVNDVLRKEESDELWDVSSFLDEDPNSLWDWVRKCQLPLLLVLTVLMCWEHHPLTLAVEIVLFLLSSKPRPLSVYLFIEQLHRHAIRQGPVSKVKKYIADKLNLKTTSCYAKKVEVRDYKLLCLAKVELIDKRMTLMGILGWWWVLQSSP